MVSKGTSASTEADQGWRIYSCWYRGRSEPGMGAKENLLPTGGGRTGDFCSSSYGHWSSPKPPTPLISLYHGTRTRSISYSGSLFWADPSVPPHEMCKAACVPWRPGPVCISSANAVSTSAREGM